MADDRRKTWIWGLSPGNVITLALIAIGGVSSWVALQQKVMANTEKIEEVKTDVKEKIEEVKKDLRDQIQQSENRTRDEIRELRRVIMDELKK